MQLLAHCNGDRAAEQYMDMLETVYRELGSGNSRKPGFYRGDIRPVMIHAQLLGLDQLERVKKLGIIPSFFLAHVYHWGISTYAILVRRGRDASARLHRP